MTSPAQPMLDEATRAEITRFVGEVEKALGDLPSDDIAELTDGLEADLTEAWAAEGTTPTQRFGSPEAYASDLRAAAGLPPPTGHFPRQVRMWQSQVAELRTWVLGLPGGPAVVRWAMELRPAWWVARAPLMLTLLTSVVIGLPGDAALTLGLVSLALIVVSLRWKGAAQAHGNRQLALRVWNVLAVVGLLLGWSIFRSYYITYSEANSWNNGPAATKGLVTGNGQVTNVFAYDESGQPLTRIRLYDQDGTPLTIGDWRETIDAAGNSLQSVPDSGDGPAEWNLFPLLGRAETDPLPDGTSGPPAVIAPPYKQVPALPQSTIEPDHVDGADGDTPGTGDTDQKNDETQDTGDGS